MTRLAGLLLLTQALAAISKPEFGFWQGGVGKAASESESLRTGSDFAGALIVTPDNDWRKNRNAPPGAKQDFSRADVVPYGKKFYVLIFFANPGLDSTGKANVRCDLKLTAPDGRVTLAQNDLVCFAGRFVGSSDHLRLTGPVIVFSGEQGDPPGIWLVVRCCSAESRVAWPFPSARDLP